MFMSFRCLEKLDLGHNRIDENDTFEICERLRGSRQTMVSMNFAANRFMFRGRPDFDTEHAPDAWWEAWLSLPRMPVLSQYSFDGLLFDYAQNTVDAVCRCHALKTLRLSRESEVESWPCGAQADFGELGGCSQLTNLSVRSAGLDSAMARSLAEVMPSLSLLRGFQAGGNDGVPPDDVTELIKGLASTQCLREVSFLGCQVGPEQASELVSMLSGKRWVQSIDVSYCHLGDEGARDIWEAALKLPSLCSLRIVAGNDLSDAVREELESCRRSHPWLSLQ